MTENTIELEIALLLPNIQNDQDECLKRLEYSMQNQKGILRAHLEREKEPIDLCLHFDPNLVTLEQVRRMAERTGSGITNRYRHALIPIEGLDCSDCVVVLEHSLMRLDGVLAVNVNYASQLMRIEFDKNRTDLPAIKKRVRSLGYEVPETGFKSWYKKNHEVILSATSGLLLLLGWLGGSFLGLPALVSNAFYLAAYILGGWEVSRHAMHALRERHFDTDLLMVAAALGAAVLGDFAEGALLLFLFSLGHALEERALDRARNAVRALADLSPRVALVRRQGLEVETPIEQLELDDIVIVRPDSRIPVDGVILAGQSGVDQSSVTGESVPVDKNPGDQVFASTVNGEGALDIRVTRLAKDSTLARVMTMVEEAQTQKSPTQQTIEKFERVFVPTALIVTGLVIFVPPLFGIPFDESFLRAMTLLVAVSPCALALGTPAAILAGVAQAARNGVLVKGGVHLENLGHLKAIAFDKTGTITHGLPEVTNVYAIDTSMDENQLLALAATLESRSGHPLAKSVARAARSKGLVLPSIQDVESLTSRGLRANSEGRTILLGSLNLMNEFNVSISNVALEKMTELQSEGKTIMLVALDGIVAGLIAVADTIRPEINGVLERLRQLGVQETIMLTGDNSKVAGIIAKQAGLTDFRANLLPEDKVKAIRDLVEGHGQVAMIGDGVNDAPALANATVGIAMGGAGTDIALETADVALMSDDLSRLPYAVGLGRATRAVIIQNIIIAMTVIAFLVVVSLTGWASMGFAILFHEGSTIIVVLNALRLLGYESE